MTQNTSQSTAGPDNSSGAVVSQLFILIPGGQQPVKAPNTRREFIWSTHHRGRRPTLEQVSQQFGNFLGLRGADDPSIPLRRRQGPNPHRFHHKCSGYTREEITLTSNITDSAIIMHSFPTPRETCLICGEQVSEAELFVCPCGSGESENMWWTKFAFDWF